MDDAILSMRYAKALFELATEKTLVAEISHQLDLLNSAISKNPEWIKLLNNMDAPTSIKNKMIDQVSKTASLHKFVISLLKVLVSKQRIHLVPNIFREYSKSKFNLEGIVETEVTVAEKEVWKVLKGDIEMAVSKISGKRPLLKHKIDPDIIGGLIIRLGDRVFDGSVMGELRKFKENIMEGSEEILKG
jgi:F-type H+-transporting ATPase subunit delta